MFELFVGLFALGLGWMCLDYLSRVRSPTPKRSF